MVHRQIRICILYSILLLIAHSVYGLQSNDFTEHLASIIYGGCKGNDIILKNNWFVWTYEDGHKEFINELKWPQYNEEEIKDIIEYLYLFEPYPILGGSFIYDSGSVRFNINGKIYETDDIGRNIIQCNEHNLDISSIDYFWDNVKVQLPAKKIDIQSGGKATFGEKSPIVESYGLNSPIIVGDSATLSQDNDNLWIQLFLSKGTIGGAIIGSILALLGRILYDKYKSRKLSKKKIK